MTAPDVAALAAALVTITDDKVEHHPRGDKVSINANQFAEAIIAALAAQGWRITNESLSPNLSPSAGLRKDAAVRAALEGLRAEVVALPGFRDPRYSGDFETLGIVHRDQTLAIIDARLAALDA